MHLATSAWRGLFDVKMVAGRAPLRYLWKASTPSGGQYRNYIIQAEKTQISYFCLCGCQEGAEISPQLQDSANNSYYKPFGSKSASPPAGYVGFLLHVTKFTRIKQRRSILYHIWFYLTELKVFLSMSKFCTFSSRH